MESDFVAHGRNDEGRYSFLAGDPAGQEKPGFINPLWLILTGPLPGGVQATGAEIWHISKLPDSNIV